jgi:hypothetical protein
MSGVFQVKGLLTPCKPSGMPFMMVIFHIRFVFQTVWSTAWYIPFLAKVGRMLMFQ